MLVITIPYMEITTWSITGSQERSLSNANQGSSLGETNSVIQISSNDIA